MSYRYCSACSKYIQKKLFNLHLKKHENGELSGKIDIEDENDLDKDDEDHMLIIDDEPVTEEAEDIEVDNSRVNGSSVTLDKIYNCFDCNRMFMSAEAQANHLRDVHGGEGGSVWQTHHQDISIRNQTNSNLLMGSLIICRFKYKNICIKSKSSKNLVVAI